MKVILKCFGKTEFWFDLTPGCFFGYDVLIYRREKDAKSPLCAQEKTQRTRSIRAIALLFFQKFSSPNGRAPYDDMTLFPKDLSQSCTALLLLLMMMMMMTMMIMMMMMMLLLVYR